MPYFLVVKNLILLPELKTKILKKHKEMIRRLLFAQLFISCIISFTNAALEVKLGNAVKTDTYYTFPNLTVTGNVADKGYVIRIMFTRATDNADVITLPTSWPGSGWKENENSTKFVRMIDITDGATAAQLQSYLQTVKISFASNKKGQGIMVLLSDKKDDAGRQMYYSSDNDHWYEYVPHDKIHWHNAYNDALDKRFMGMTGYLATITDNTENSFIFKVSGGKLGWIAGTRMNITPVLNSVTGKLSGAPNKELSYWYWAAGPEWNGNGKTPSGSVFYRRRTYDSSEDLSVSLKYPYNAWYSKEPNDASGEYYTHLKADGSWNDYSVNNTSIVGYIVEYLGQLSGPSSSGTVGFESAKKATPGNGTSASPIQIVYGDEVIYTITAANASDVNTSVKIVDEVPVGMEVVNGSITNQGTFSSSTHEITWNTQIPVEGTGTVSFKAKKSLHSTNTMENTAKVTSGGVTQQTNSTYHKGVVSKVTFTAGAGGSLSNGGDQFVDYDHILHTGVIPHPNTGYSFRGWSYPEYTSLKGVKQATKNDIADYMTIKVLGNMALTANFKLETYKIEYKLNEGTANNPTEYNVQTNTFTLGIPVRKGYKFLGWTGTNGGDPQETVEIPKGSFGNREYVANWEINKYTIDYKYDEGIASPIENPHIYYVNSPEITLNNPTRKGHEFLGWTWGSITDPQKLVKIPTGSTGNLVFLANWKPIEYGISYTYNNGNPPANENPKVYTIINTPFEITNQPTRSGYKFDGWIGSNGSSPQEIVTVNEGTIGVLAYEAVWTIKAYHIEYDYNGGDGPSVANRTSYDIIDTPFEITNEPTRLGHTFAGWTGTNLTEKQHVIKVAAGTTGNLDYIANWDAIDYRIKYELDGGTEITNPSTYQIVSKDFVLNEPTRKGYTFGGWTGSNGVTEQRTVEIPKGTYGELEYTAHWDTITYEIKYEFEKGIGPSVANPIGYNIEQTPFTISNQPTRPGYKFMGWTGSNGGTGQKEVTVPTGTAEVLNYKANWEIVSYKIKYEYKGGFEPSAPNPKNFDVTETPFEIENQPTKSGHKFVGWTGSNGSVPELSAHVCDTTMHDLTYTAKWSFQFQEDTISICSGSVKIESGNDGLSYEWVLPDGSSRTTSSVVANQSGDYILYTNYGSMVMDDTIYVLILFEESLKIDYTTTIGNKVGSEFTFFAPLSEYVDQVTYQWNIPGATPSTFTGDTAKVVFNSFGKKNVSVHITALDGTQRCNKPLELELQILPDKNGFFVDQNVSSGRNDGTSWANAYKTIQEALAHAGKNDYIWVAKGTYHPDKNTSFMANYDNIGIYGGFEGWESDLSERDFAKNPTILKGNGNSVIINSNTEFIVWDGFTIEGGEASSGGGILNSKSSIVIANCIIRNNKADIGGGIYSSHATPVLYNVVISGNTANEGGAMYNDLTNPEITNVTISGNKAKAGGGLYNVSSNPDMNNSILWGNKADKDPNIYNDSSTPVFYYSLIEGSKDNSAWNSLFGQDGGYNLDGNPFFRKNGFDKEGDMVAGDYELYTSSPGIDKGNKVYAYGISVLMGIDLSLLTGEQRTSLLYDLNMKERIGNDKVDMGAYEFGASSINPEIKRMVRLPSVEGMTTDPPAGENFVRSHHDFVFTITAEPGYSLRYLDVKTGIPLRDKEGIRIEKYEDANKDANENAKITILQVTEPLDITINGINPVSNTEIDNRKVWSHGDELYIKTEKEADLSIYEMNGYLYMQRKVKEPETVILLDRGVYTVVLDEITYKIVIKK